MNYIESSRTNTFKVQDLEAFKLNLPGEITCLSSEDNHVTLLGEYGEPWPSFVYDENDEGVEFEIVDYIQRNLHPESVAVIIGAGNEGLRYINGYAIAIHPVKGVLQINLSDIYKKAEEAWGFISIDRAEA